MPQGRAYQDDGRTEQGTGRRPGATPDPSQVAGSVRDGRARLVRLVPLLLAAAVGVIGGSYAAVRNEPGPPAAPKVVTPTSAAPRSAPLPAQVASFDPSGGSGFLAAGAGIWRTEIYRSDRFGNLKAGVGLLLDLGRARPVTSVAVAVVGSPVTLQLLEADAPVTALAGLRTAGGPVTTAGTVTLPAAASGPHRYWLVWVTRLAPVGGGFAAVLHTPVARG